MTTIKAAVIQQSYSADPANNLQKLIGAIREAAAQGAELLLLPELATLPYFCITEDPRHFDLAETIPGPSSQTYGALARELSILIVTTLFEKRAAGVYHNTAVVFDRDGSIAGTYRKMHIPDDPGFYEKYYFTPGDQGFAPIQTSIGKLGVLICWDQWFPEAARLMALAGAELLFYPSAIGWDPRDDEQEQINQRNAWMSVQKAHAVVNNLPTLVSNRVGLEPDPSQQTQGTNFWGSSFITGAQGELLAKAHVDREVTIMADIDMQQTERVRRIWPYLRDRRIDAYGGLLKRVIEPE